jgi:hypothetical protein
MALCDKNPAKLRVSPIEGDAPGRSIRGRTNRSASSTGSKRLRKFHLNWGNSTAIRNFAMLRVKDRPGSRS